MSNGTGMQNTMVSRGRKERLLLDTCCNITGRIMEKLWTKCEERFRYEKYMTPDKERKSK